MDEFGRLRQLRQGLIKAVRTIEMDCPLSNAYKDVIWCIEEVDRLITGALDQNNTEAQSQKPLS